MKKINQNFIVAFISLSLLIISGCDVSVKQKEDIKTIESTREEQSNALQATNAFLKKLDEGNYDIWKDLSASAQKTSSETEWTLLTKTMRKAVGKNIKRESYRFACTDNLPGAPKGRYFIFDINSTYELTNVTERVITALENDKWKIAGYHMSKYIPFK
jgi:hypothetical protein